MKKLIVTGIIAGLMAISTSAFAATRAEIVAAAKAEVPAQAFMFGYQADGAAKIKLNFQDPATLLIYELEVDKESGKVMEMEVKGASNAKSLKVVKTQAEIEKIVLEEYPDAKNLVVKLEQEGDKYEYEAEFNTAKFSKVEMEFNPTTGAIVKREMKFR